MKKKERKNKRKEGKWKSDENKTVKVNKPKNIAKKQHQAVAVVPENDEEMEALENIDIDFLQEFEDY